MFLVFYFFFVFFLSFFCLISNNLILWWSIFLLITLVFLTINKFFFSYSGLINYFIIQETAGLLFLFLRFSFFQFLILFLKIGIAPLHFWLFSVLTNVSDLNLLWFLTFQKLPFIFVLFQLFFNFVLLTLVFGLFFCQLQFFFLKKTKFLIIVSSTERFNWFLILNRVSFFFSFYLFIYYLIVIVFILFKINNQTEYINTWETLLVFLNVPIMATFFIKIFSLTQIVNFSLSFLIILAILFLSSIAFLFWLVQKTTKEIFYNIKSKLFVFMFFCVSFLCLFYYFSIFSMLSWYDIGFVIKFK